MSATIETASWLVLFTRHFICCSFFEPTNSPETVFSLSKKFSKTCCHCTNPKTTLASKAFLLILHTAVNLPETCDDACLQVVPANGAYSRFVGAEIHHQTTATICTYTKSSSRHFTTWAWTRGQRYSTRRNIHPPVGYASDIGRAEGSRETIR